MPSKSIPLNCGVLNFLTLLEEEQTMNIQSTPILSQQEQDARFDLSHGPVREELFAPDQPLPLVMRAVSPVDSVAWVTENRPLLQKRLDKHGAVLFRGFGSHAVDKFHELACALAGDLLEYKERSSPRHEEGERIYTSTDYPPEYSIYLHNEHSYARSFPMKLFFCCITPAEKGGQTPLADVRRVLSLIDPQIQTRFQQKKWMYVRNYGSFGLPWHTAFQTSNRAEVEAYCDSHDIQWEWKPDGSLRTRQVRPAMQIHPRTGERVWFNHATFFHVTTLPPAMAKVLQGSLREEDLPNNTYYGDGSPIEAETLSALRNAYEQQTVAFDWQRGDMLVVDNMLVAHSRAPYSGKRSVLVAMAEPFKPTNL
jgi:alpha-ketoglutarate-dependent taurine dioxygenase